MKKLLFISLFSCAAPIILAQISATTPVGKLRYAEQAIARFYVDTINENELVESAIRGMLEGLDPHSIYTDPKETKELNEPLEGNFSGIGITYNMVKDTLYVISTVVGGPSEKVGILPGDRIIAVNDSSIAGQKFSTSVIMKKLRGERGTTVNLTVLRDSDTIPFRLVRAEIPIFSIDAAYMADPSTGYVAISRFGSETAEEFHKAVGKLKKQGMQNIIIDLCDNGGGYLNAAVELLSEMLEPGSLAVYTEGTNAPRTNLRTNPLGAEPLLKDGRIVVMVNQYSASASEITSGALQDWDRAVIVGRRTYGKGLVQRPIPFPDGSMMRLTISHYFTPTGRDIQKPYAKGDDESYNKDILNRFEGGELMHVDSVHLDSTKLTHTLQFHRPIFGGGGIMPDSFVPLDTTQNTKYFRNIMAKGIFTQYAANYVDLHRKQIKKQYKTDDLFVQHFEVTPAMLDEIRAMADKESVEYVEDQWIACQPLVAANIKGLIGRNIYESQTFDKVFNLRNPIFIEALRIINSPDYDRLLQGTGRE